LFVLLPFHIVFWLRELD